MKDMVIFDESPRSPDERRASMSIRGDQDYSDYGEAYYDHPQGVYGGYHYDGRYEAAAKRMVEEFNLNTGDYILEIGCAKGFVLVELRNLGMNVTGLEVSKYAIENCHPDLRGYIRPFHDSPRIPYAAKYFDFIFCKEALPHLPEYQALFLVFEMMRAGNSSFLEIQCANSTPAIELTKQWDPTHKTVKPEGWWRNELEKLGYQGGVHFKELFP